MRTELAEIERKRTDEPGEFVEDVAHIIFVGGGERVSCPQMMEAVTPMIPGSHQLRRRAQPVQFVAHRVGSGGGEAVRISIGDASGKIVRFIHQQQRARRHKARLLEEQNDGTVFRF